MRRQLIVLRITRSDMPGHRPFLQFGFVDLFNLILFLTGLSDEIHRLKWVNRLVNNLHRPLGLISLVFLVGLKKRQAIIRRHEHFFAEWVVVSGAGFVDCLLLIG